MYDPNYTMSYKALRGERLGKYLRRPYKVRPKMVGEPPIPPYWIEREKLIATLYKQHMKEQRRKRALSFWLP